ncbi:MAG: hypothetical protein HY286_08205 [Planctomycetes bacterium]|nr:hypothetical protein [Planctomycetota bacterium]
MADSNRSVGFRWTETDVLETADSADEAARLLAYFESCAETGRFAERAPVPESGAAAALVTALSAQHRRLLAGYLLELAVASIGVSRDAGEFLPKPLLLDLAPDWLARVERLGGEFVASEPEKGPGARTVDRLKRELLLTPNARARALRCLRLARQLAPDSVEIEFSLLCHRAAKRASTAIINKLSALASGAQNQQLRARIWLVIGSLQIRKLQFNRALSSLRECLAAAPADPEALARICYIHLTLGNEDAAAEALECIGSLCESEIPLAGTADALAFLKSPASRVPRLLIANPAAATRVRKSHASFIFTILEAAQRSSAVRKAPRTPHPTEYLFLTRRRARVAWCAFVVEETPGNWICLDQSAARRYVISDGRLAAILTKGGPGGVVALARETAEPAVVLSGEGAPEFFRPQARGAAAVAIEGSGLPPAFLIMESDHTIAIDPAFLSRLADDAIGPLCALRAALR